MLEKSIKEHVELMGDQAIQSICQSFMDATGITHFIYNKMYADGHCIWLSNRLDWFLHYFQNEYYNIGAFEQGIDSYKSGFYLWAGVEENQIGVDARNYFNIDNGISIVDKNEKFCEFYHFASTRENKAIINFYINNIDLLKNFTYYFKEQAKDIIQRAEKQRILLPNQHLCPTYLNTTPVVSPLFIDGEQYKPKRYYLQGDFHKYLTRREYECVTLLAEGKSSKEIAYLLSISPKAVELYINTAKNRLNISTRSELIKLYTSKYKAI